MASFLVVPQWQGSPSARGMLLADGAEAIAGDLPRSRCERVDVPVEAGEAQGTGVRRLTSLRRTHERVREALEGTSEPTVIVGGDCGVAVPGIAHAVARHPHLAVVWFDAHADLNDPASSPSGAFAGMALRAVAGDGQLALPAGSVPPDRIVLAGAREFDDAERAYIDAAGVRTVPVPALADPTAVVEAVAATGATDVYLHVDLDVLDPGVITGLTAPVPFGLEPAQLTAAIDALRTRFAVAGASVSGFAPATPMAAVDDLGTILRVIGALTRKTT